MPPSPGSVFDDPTIPVDRATYLRSEPTRSRILEPEAWVDESEPFPYGPTAAYEPPTARSELFAERHAPPFAPAGPHREANVPPLERLLEGAYRWRSLLGLGLAALMTVAIVVAYRGASGNEPSDLAAADGQTGAAFGDTTVPSTVALSGSLPGADQQVGSSVGEVASTTQFPAGPSQTQTSAPATVRSTTSTIVRNTSSSGTGATTPTTGPSSTASNAPGSSSTPSSSAPSSSTPTGQPTTSSPSASTGSSTATSLNTAAKLEAEGGSLLGGAQVAADHEGYNGTGFVSDIVAPGRGVTVTAPDMAAGPTTVRIRYAAGNTALASPRRLTLRVNGIDVRGGVTMANTASWTEWKTVSVDIELKEGNNTLTLILANGDNGVVNIDSFEIG
ncbi:MAG: carbohydrate-binding protein [Acidimicrobiia bacterium]|nr:carbohydrate-binding protein [Acidimicrobiia bacterium]MDH5291207.1 carbohydrate-binding protein [Acidimicrobiia bacterium]